MEIGKRESDAEYDTSIAIKSRSGGFLYVICLPFFVSEFTKNDRIRI